MLIQKEIVLAEIQDSLPGASSLFFDIETTGLSWQRSHVYLIGAAYGQGHQWLLRQWFLQKPSEEKELLQEFASFLSGFTQIIHYNGQSFDLPYLSHKYDFYQLQDPLLTLESLDLYRVLRPLSPLLGLSSLKLQEVEAQLGIPRQDHHKGQELITAYRSYLQEGSEILLQLLLEHNQEDICGLLPLYRITAYSSLQKGLFAPASPYFQEDQLILPLELQDSLPYPLHIRQGSCGLEAAGRQACLTVQATEGRMKHFFSNYKDYYYLPLEKQVVHKSIGIFVDSSHRRKAKPAECCQSATGQFFYQPQVRFQPDFYPDYPKKEAYFLPDSRWPGNRELLKSYLCDLLQILLPAFHQKR